MAHIRRKFVDVFQADGSVTVEEAIKPESHPQRTVVYRLRNCIERFFNKLKHFATSPPAAT